MLIIVIICYILFMVKDIIVWLMFALVLSILFNYAIDGLEKKRVPRILSAVVLYLGIFALLGFFVYKTTPILINEFDDLVSNFPQYLDKVIPVLDKLGIDLNIEKAQGADAVIQTLQNSLGVASTSVIDALFVIFGGATSTILVLAMAFFISIEGKFIERLLANFCPAKNKEYAFELWKKAKKKVSGWFITRLIGVLFVGSGSYLVLSILNVKYAFLLSLMAGVFDLVPIIGPVVAGIAMFFMVALNSLLQAAFAGGAFIIIQQLEGNVLFPLLFRRFVGISSVLVLVALAVGAKLWGIAGAILAIPLAAVVHEILKDYLRKVRKEETQAV